MEKLLLIRKHEIIIKEVIRSYFSFESSYIWMKYTILQIEIVFIPLIYHTIAYSPWITFHCFHLEQSQCHHHEWVSRIKYCLPAVFHLLFLLLHLAETPKIHNKSGKNSQYKVYITVTYRTVKEIKLICKMRIVGGFMFVFFPPYSWRIYC